MIKTISKVGNSQGLIFDSALCELTGLKAGDQVNVTVHEGGSIVLTPMRRSAPTEVVTAAIKRTVKDYRKTLKKLA
jgi:antitoxin component of MazEF toxin-antitoxin module